MKMAEPSKPGTRVHRRGFHFLTARVTLFLLISVCLACRRNRPLTPYTAYVVNYQSATLTAVNLADFHVIGSVEVAPHPQRVLLRPGTQQLYVVSEPGRISVVAFPGLRLVGSLDAGRSAKDLAFSPDGSAAYLLDPADQDVVFADCGGGSGSSAGGEAPKITFRLHLNGTPANMALSPDGKTLVISSSNPNQLTFVSTADHESLGSIEAGQSPGPMAILPDNSKVFVADTGEEKISVADLPTRKLLSHIEIGVRPTALLVKPDGGELFILGGASSTLVIVDAFHDNVEQTFPLGTAPAAGVFRRDMSVLYIANAGDGSVFALDVANRQVLATAHIGMEPRALALTPDERLLVVADRAASSLAILQADPASLSKDRSVLITTVPVGAAPVDVIVPDIIANRR